MGAARVVAADARLGGAPDVQGLRELVRVRARGGVDDRPDSVRELELLVAPVGALGPFVRAEADGLGLLVERLARVAGVEAGWIISQSPSCRLLKSLNA